MSAIVGNGSAGNFDPDVFMGSVVMAPLDTKYHPCPAADYIGVIAKIEPKIIKFDDKETGQPRESLMFEVYWEIDDQTARNETGRDRVMVKTPLFIDRNASNHLDTAKGKNINLGKLREAIGQNVPGQPWSPTMMIGAAARIKVTHRPDKTTGDMYDEVLPKNISPR